MSTALPVHGWATTVVTNTSDAACSLPVARIGVLSDGKTLPLRQIPGQPFFGNGPVVHTLRPGKSARFDIAWQNWCAEPGFRHGGPYTETLELRLGSALTVIGQIRRPDCTLRGSPSTIAVAQPRSWVPN